MGSRGIKEGTMKEVRCYHRKDLVSTLTRWLKILDMFRGHRVIWQNKEHGFDMRIDQMSINRHRFARAIRRFRIKYGIYECF